MFYVEVKYFTLRNQRCWKGAPCYSAINPNICYYFVDFDLVMHVLISYPLITLKVLNPGYWCWIETRKSHLRISMFLEISKDIFRFPLEPFIRSIWKISTLIIKEIWLKPFRIHNTHNKKWALNVKGINGFAQSTFMWPQVCCQLINL